MSEAARSQAATPELRAAILELIGRPVRPFLLTTTRTGYPYSRPVICVNHGFSIQMVTRRQSRKIGHLRRNPHAALLWSDPPRSVLLQGEVTIVDDPGVVLDFYRRYSAKNPERQRFSVEENAERVVIDLRPTFCRADWFAGYVPVILRADMSY